MNEFKGTEPPRSGATSVFVNLSNHASAQWTQAQRDAALGIALTVVDVPFPAVPPEADSSEIGRIADACVATLPEATLCAMVQGEFTLTYAIVQRLRKRGTRCVAATTEREVVSDGEGRRTSVFRFVRFRDYDG